MGILYLLIGFLLLEIPEQLVDKTGNIIIKLAAAGFITAFLFSIIET